MAVPKKRTSASKKRIRKNCWKRTAPIYRPQIVTRNAV